MLSVLVFQKLEEIDEILEVYPNFIIRLILPVSHFLVKRLIHACVWHYLFNACGRLIKTEITYSQKQTDNFANCEANT